MLLGGVAQRHRQRGHQPGARALAFLAVQVQRVARGARTRRGPTAGGDPPAVAGDPAGDVRIAQEGEDLPGGAEHAAALLERRVHVIEHRGGGELEPVVLQDARGLVVVRARRPQERLRDRPLSERGRAQQVTDELLAGRVKERVRARVRIAVGADERVGQLERAAIGGDVGERVPPPVGLARGELLGIEVPHPPLPLAQAAGGGVQVGLVRGRERRARCRQHGGDRARAGLAFAAAPRCRTACPPTWHTAADRRRSLWRSATPAARRRIAQRSLARSGATPRARCGRYRATWLRDPRR